MVKTKLKAICNTMLAPLQLEVHRRGADANWQRYVARQNDEYLACRLQKQNKVLWVKESLIQTVIDVGANLGQFSTEIRALLPNVQIYAFEPLPDCFAQLQIAFAGDSRFQSFNFGLGESVGEMKFERNDFSASSSFLTKTEAHTGAFPFTGNTSVEVVKIERLDNVVSNLKMVPPLMLKIDVQGFEDRVLRGGEMIARKADIILVETSFVELYEQQPLFDDIYELLKSWGFTYQGSFDQLRDPRTGKVLQEDSVFVRT